MTAHTASLVAVALCLSQAYTHASDWPRFRGPDGAGISADVGVPAKWSATENILWKTPLPGRGASSPAVYKGRIYLTAFTGYGIERGKPGEISQLRLHLLCIDTATGKIVWDESMAASDKAQRMDGGQMAGHGYASSTPACDDTGIYTYFGVSGAAAFDFEGKLRWRTVLGTGTKGFGSGASPILFENLMILNASVESGSLIALDKKTGKEVWRAGDIDAAWCTPNVLTTADGKPELVMSCKKSIAGYDPRTGKKLWTCKGIEDYVVPSVIGEKGVAYCLGGRANQGIAVRLGGRGDVTATHTLWSIRIGANITTPVLHDGKLYWGNDRGFATCVDAKTGAEIYRERLPIRGRIYASTVLADGKLYVSTLEQGVFVIAAEPQFKQIANNLIEDDKSPFHATPAIYDGTLLLRSEQFLYRIGTAKTAAR